MNLFNKWFFYLFGYPLFLGGCFGVGYTILLLPMFYETTGWMFLINFILACMGGLMLYQGRSLSATNP